MGGALGVIAGLVFVLFGVPPLLNFLFPGETVEAGETFENDKLTLRIDQVARATTEDGVTIVLEVTARSTWSLDEVLFVLETAEGVEEESARPSIDDHEVERVPQGRSRLVLTFDLRRAQPPHEPAYLHVSEPNVKFRLTQDASP